MDTSFEYQHELAAGAMIHDLQIVETLSNSVHGQVYLAKNIRTLQYSVIKSLSHSNLTPRQLAFQKNEILLHSHLSKHPHIINLESIIKETQRTHIVIEYGSEGDLFSAIAEKNCYIGNHALIRHVFLQLIEAVRFCHTNGVYHRDLKPENILVFDQGRTLKIADFGLATTDCYSKDYGCGSKFYFSPECHGGFLMDSQKGYATAPNDVWSLGVVLVNLATGRNPWHVASLNDEIYSAFLRDPDLLLKTLPISSELNQILKRVFSLDPSKRITLDELHFRILHCPYFTYTPQSQPVRKADFVTDLPTPPDTPNLDLDTTTFQEPAGCLQQDALFPELANEV
ncbi:kinase-like domain-containing protein [Sporodiniella umbellata]|nr:kinase-like domain-containing protein [Sporodiniella umbellata]